MKERVGGEKGGGGRNLVGEIDERFLESEGVVLYEEYDCNWIRRPFFSLPRGLFFLAIWSLIMKRLFVSESGIYLYECDGDPCTMARKNGQTANKNRKAVVWWGALSIVTSPKASGPFSDESLLSYFRYLLLDHRTQHSAKRELEDLLYHMEMENGRELSQSMLYRCRAQNSSNRHTFEFWHMAFRSLHLLLLLTKH